LVSKGQVNFFQPEINEALKDSLINLNNLHREQILTNSIKYDSLNNVITRLDKSIHDFKTERSEIESNYRQRRSNLKNQSIDSLKRIALEK
jgi:hypothetical protein